MTKTISAVVKAAAVGLVALCWAGSVGCENSKTTSQTEVHDKLTGGTQVKETEVKEQGDKTQVTETKTDLKSDGTLEKKETTVKGDKLN